MRIGLRRPMEICAALICAVSYGSARQEEDPLWDLVSAVAGEGEILLRTLGTKGVREPRHIRLPVEKRPESVQMSKSGTKMLVLADGKLFLGDLTGPVPIWNRCQQLHVLPGRPYVVRLPGEIVVLGDGALTQGCPDASRRVWSPEGAAEGPETGILPGELPAEMVLRIETPLGATSAAIDDSEVVLYVDSVPRLHRVAGGADQVIDLPESASDVEVVANPHAGKGFRVILKTGGRHRVYEIESAEGGLNPPAGEAATLFDARIQALAVSPRAAGALPPDRNRKDATAWGVTRDNGWYLFHVAPDPQLYAPVLEMDQYEKVRPSRIDIWAQFKDKDLGDSKAILPMYQALKPNAKPCALYYEIRSYPGSWLIEYWTYYLLDLGDLNGHPHDSEHTFVEIDKLGGRPLAVLSAAHLRWTPGNVYSSLDVKNAEQPQLPLFVFVEYGKHAMAPDIDHDGIITFGRDVNGYRERAYLWGIRDYTGVTDAHTSAWTGDMAVPRVRRYRLAPRGFKEYFGHRLNHLGIDLDSCECGLARFSEVSEASPGWKPPKKALASRQYQQQAAWELQAHPDHVNPEAIYKRRVFPDTAIRLGFEWNLLDQTQLASAAVATSLMRPFGMTLPFTLPGRLAMEFSMGLVDVNRSVRVSVLQGDVIVQRDATFTYKRAKAVGARYEKMITNLFGFQVGVHRMFQKVVPAAGFQNVRVDDKPLYYRAGLMAAFGRWIVQAGPVWTNDKSRGIGFEVRSSVDVFSWKGRSHFGIP